MQLLNQTSIPKGVVNMIQGDHHLAEQLLQHESIKAISFIGSTPIGKHVFEEASKNGKRVQSNGGAKNHCIVMPDYPRVKAANAILGAAFGASGQRCMALSVAIIVGEEDDLINLIIEGASQMSIGCGVNNPDLGPLTDSKQMARIKALVIESELKGAKVSLYFTRHLFIHNLFP
jgi:malonate-semialdehyde dehydrogenase (acetylating)/methylmalonate-semialdehyde dehydrogenase